METSTPQSQPSPRPSPLLPWLETPGMKTAMRNKQEMKQTRNKSIEVNRIIIEHRTFTS